MDHIVTHCPITRFPGGLWSLHQADGWALDPSAEFCEKSDGLKFFSADIRITRIYVENRKFG